MIPILLDRIPQSVRLYREIDFYRISAGFIKDMR